MSDVGSEDYVKERKSAARLEREREIAEMARVLDLPAGRAFLWRILERGGLHQLSYVPGGDTHQTAFNEGARNIANWLLSECLTARPQCYNVMRNEAEERSRQGMNNV